MLRYVLCVHIHKHRTGGTQLLHLVHTAFLINNPHMGALGVKY